MSQHEIHVDATTKVVAFLQKNAKLLLIVIIALVILGAAAIVGAKIARDNRGDALVAWELIEEQYNEFIQIEKDSEDWESSRVALVEEINTYLSSTNGNGFGDMQARTVQGQLYVLAESYSDAADAFMALYDYHPESYTAPMALFNAAAAYEAAGEADKAIESYQKIIDTQDRNPLADIVKAYFYKGRVAYQQGDLAGATATWNEMIEAYSNDSAASEWINLAKTVLLTVE